MDYLLTDSIPQLSLQELISKTFQDILNTYAINYTENIWHRIEKRQQTNLISIGQLYMNSNNNTYQETTISINSCPDKDWFVSEKHIIQGKFNTIDQFQLVNIDQQPIFEKKDFHQVIEFIQENYQCWEHDIIGGEEIWQNKKSSVNYYLTSIDSDCIKMVNVIKNNNYYQVGHHLDHNNFIYKLHIENIC